jgi:hypothetical protein
MIGSMKEEKKKSRSFVVHFVKMDVVEHRPNVALPQLGVDQPKKRRSG